jgi:uncharacterized membrane-anchored protein
MRIGYKRALIVTLQVLFLFSMIGFKIYTLNTGTAILLKTEPIDPWDMFRGEYVALNYEISTLNGSEVEENLERDKHLADGDEVYVVLEKGTAYWQAVSINNNKPKLKDNQVYIKAKLQYYDDVKREYALNYGIESYYVEESQGRQLEQHDYLNVTVRVDNFGNAVIEKVTS